MIVRLGIIFSLVVLTIFNDRECQYSTDLIQTMKYGMEIHLFAYVTYVYSSMSIKIIGHLADIRMIIV